MFKGAHGYDQDEKVLKAFSAGGAERPACTVQNDIAVRLLAREYQDAYIDLALSDANHLGGYDFGGHSGVMRVGGSSPIVRTAKKKIEEKPLGRRVSLREEMPRAIIAYDAAVACVRDFMAAASQGRFYAAMATEAVEGLVDSLERNVDALLCLPRLRQRDAYIYTHSVNVAVLLAAYALCAGEARAKVMTNALAGFFHDIGKALLPVALLTARRKLSITEQTLVARHPMLGCDLLGSLPDLHPDIILAALEHHERYDGSGYPKGISGTDISEIGQLCAIADAYDALSSRRPYKGAISPHKTLGVLYQMRQKQFHSEMVESFVRMVGIYPVGCVVELKDGYRGVVTASNYANPMLPMVTLALDPQGGAMCRHECDMAKDLVAGIARCLPAEVSGIDPCQTLGIML